MWTKILTFLKLCGLKTKLRVLFFNIFECLMFYFILFFYDSLNFFFKYFFFFCFWKQNKAKSYLIKHWMWCERIYLIALNVEWKILFYFVGFGLGVVKKIITSSWPLKKLQYICCNIWNLYFFFAIIFIFYFYTSFRYKLHLCEQIF
jgi:hypothetical protein